MIAKCHCLRCRHEWFPRTRVPVRCPACHSTRWNGDARPVTAPRPTLHCNRCGHDWEPLTDRIPAHCPACGSGCWNQPADYRHPGPGRPSRNGTVPRPSRKKLYPYSPRPEAAPPRGDELVMQKFTCVRCKHEWYPRVRAPLKCPKCRSAHYAGDAFPVKAPRPKLRCSRCTYEWEPLGDRLPGHCPACGSPRWNAPPTPHAPGKGPAVHTRPVKKVYPYSKPKNG